MATELYTLNLIGRHQQEYNECVMYFVGSNLTAGDVIPNARDLIVSFQTNCLGPWLDLFPATYQLERLVARRTVPKFGVDVMQQYQQNQAPGTVSGGASAQQLCPIVRWIPPTGVKSAGRNFLPCIAESQIANNQPNATWIANLASFASAVLTDFGANAISWQIAIYSRLHQTYSTVMDYDTSPVVGWQKKRQRPF